MAQIITTETTDVNTSSILSSYQSVPQDVVSKRQYLSQDMFNYTHERKRSWVLAVSIEFRLKPSQRSVVEELAFLTDPVSGVGSPAIGTIKEALEKKGIFLHYESIRRILANLDERNIVRKTPGKIIKRKKTPNTYKLIGYENKLEDYYDNVRNSLNSSLNPKDNTINTNYDEYVSFFTNSEIKTKKKETNQQSKRIDKQKLESTDEEREEEVKRICILYGLTPIQVSYVIYKMKNRKDIKCSASYLSTITRRISNHEWEVTKSFMKYVGECSQQTYFRDKARQDIEVTKKRMEEKTQTLDSIALKNILETIRKRNSGLDNQT